MLVAEIYPASFAFFVTGQHIFGQQYFAYGRVEGIR